MHIGSIDRAPAPLELWLNYCIARGLTPDMLTPLKGELLTIEQASKIMGAGIYGTKPDGAVGAYVFEVSPGEYQARIMYRDEDAIPKVGEQTKPKKRLKYYRPKNSVNVLFIPPHLTDWHAPTNEYNLLVVEGALNATRLAAVGYHAVGITGVYNYRVGNKHSPIIPEFELLIKSEQAKTVTVMFDSDATDQARKRELWVARNRICQDITVLRPTRSSTVLMCSPLPWNDGSKRGPDDFLNFEGIDAFNKLLAEHSLRYDEEDYLKLERRAVGRYIFEQDTGDIFDTETRLSVKASHVDRSLATYGKVDDIFASKPSRIIYDHKRMLSCAGMRSSWGKVFQPDNDDIYVVNGEFDPPRYYVNTFQPEDVPQSIKGDISIVYRMMESICRNTPSAVQKLLTIVAKHAQFPALLPKYGVLMTGQQGSGKSTLARLIGLALSKRYSSSKVDLGISFNSDWRGVSCKEWPEFDKDMNEEWLKDLITGESYIVSVKYGHNYTAKNHTLNIFTCNGLQAKIQEGDRRFLVCGDAKADDKKLGLEFEAWVNGMGPSHFRYHILNDIDCSAYDLLDVWTEMKDAVIEASQSYKSTVKDYVIQECEQIEGLECIPNVILQNLLDAHKVNVISFNKEFGQHFIKPFKEMVKIDGIPHRFRAFKNHEKWRKCEDTEEYRKQFNLAQKLLTNKKF